MTRAVAAYFFYYEVYSEEEALAKGRRFFAAMEELTEYLHTVPDYTLTDEQIQFEVYEIGKRHYGVEKAILKEWFADVYFMLFRRRQGPRMGTIINIMTPGLFASNLYARCSSPFMY